MPKVYVYALHHYSSGLERVVSTWAEAQSLLGSGVKYKKFLQLADAQYFAKHGRDPPPPNLSLDDRIVVYTDGSCKTDATSGEKKAGCGVYFAQAPYMSFGVKLPSDHCEKTNNRAELFAIRSALHRIRDGIDAFAAKKSVEIRTDSSYSQKSLTIWRAGWAANNFKDNTIKNRDLIEPLWALIDSFPLPVTIEWVGGHGGIHGNEMADQLADQYAV